MNIWIIFWFWLLQINGTVNIHIWVFVWMYVFISLDRYLGREKLPSCFPKWLYHFPLLFGKYERSSFSTSLLILVQDILFLLNCFGNFARTKLTLHVRAYFNSIPLAYISVLMPVPCFVDYCNLVVSLEIRNCEFSNVFWDWALVDPLHFHINFRISMSISAKNRAGILIRIAMNL